MKLIKVGVFGLRRGMSYALICKDVGLKVVAVCDVNEMKLQEAKKILNVKTYTNYEEFLQHDMDAVILCNYFHQHAPYAIKALKVGKHVLSETSSNSTLKEGVELCKTVEKTGLIYMLAENYPFTAFNMEMKKLYKKGEIGEVFYAEGEYNHPMSNESYALLAPDINHWRNWTPSTYYCTHALAPLVYITETIPVKVNALSIPRKTYKNIIKRNDIGSVILCRMNNGAVFKLFGTGIPGHSIWYRIHGTKGAMETTRGPGYFGPGMIRVWYEEWNRKKGKYLENIYMPEWVEKKSLVKKAGHGGGDFWVCYYFAESIRKKKQPFFDVYMGVTLSSVGILAWRSALENGKSYDIPDFRNEKEREKIENDDFSPFPESKNKLPSSILGFIKPSEENLRYVEKIWKKYNIL